MEIKLIDMKIDELKPINISLSSDKIISLVGPNNSNVIDLIKLLCCNKKIESGMLEIDGNKITEKEINKELIKLQEEIFYINKQEQKLFNINILEDLNYYAKNIDKEKLNEMVELFELDQNIYNKSYFELSSSEVTKILLILGLISTKKILIIDNPTASLDNKSIQTLIKQLKKIRRENKIIILISHNTDFLIQICDKIIYEDKKQIIEQSDKYKIFSNEKLLKKLNLKMPNIVKFINEVRETKKIKLNDTDNINDLIKDIYRNAK